MKKDRLPTPYSLIIKSEEVFTKTYKKLENEKNGRVKDAREAINTIRKVFEGEAERLGLKDEEDVAEMIK